MGAVSTCHTGSRPHTTSQTFGDGGEERRLRDTLHRLRLDERRLDAALVLVPPVPRAKAHLALVGVLGANRAREMVLRFFGIAPPVGGRVG